ncbi:MAG: lactonase family protein [Sandaracinaceae bacterium]|nr:lactonase family protein [Sandaracinaceae bacterium]
MYAATIGAVRELHAWAVGAGGTLTPIGTPVSLGVSQDRLVVDPTGSFLATGGRFGTIEIFAIGSDGGPARAPGSPHSGYTGYGLAFTPLGDRLLIAGPSGVYVFDLDTSGGITPVAGGPFTVNTTGGPFPDLMEWVAVHPNGRCVTAVGGSDAVGRTAVYMFTMDAATGALTPVGAPLHVFDENSIDVAMLEDGSHVLMFNVFTGSIAFVAIDEATCTTSIPTGSPLAVPTDRGGYASMAARLAP